MIMDLNNARGIAEAEAARTGLGTGPNRRLRLALIIGMPLFLPVLEVMILVPKSLRNDVLYVYEAGIVGCLLHYVWVFVKYPRSTDRPPYRTRGPRHGRWLLPALTVLRLLAGRDRRPALGALRRRCLRRGNSAGAP
ncbi:hypothetical protein [Streptomyces sp. Act143]|uniref:hypothetical protein n=1 Tax=Streptomyces sp. Act143 TaxID=2200760 RepID=UPI00215A5693|nr:hypothetical protein [Streptomyces sp. Act143]